MTNKKSTKRALLLSLLSMLLCVTMLVGTTFAWFTDSVTSSGNIIKSGTLDVEMYWAKGTEVPAEATWTDASTGAIFNYDKWEPGYAEARHIRIENKGSLALKYAIKIVPNGEVSDLTDVIDVYYADPAVATDSSMSGLTRIGTLTNVLDGMGETASGALLAGSNDTVTIVLKMQENAGNEYQDKSIGTDFSIELVATQFTYEEDSFDDQYDVSAPIIYYDHFVENLDELKAAFAEGGNIKLTDDVKFDNMLKIENGATVYLDLNGKTVTFEPDASFKSGNPMLYPLVGTKLTITGNGTFDLGDNYDAALVYPAGEVVIENGTFIRNRVPDGVSADDVQTLFMGVKTKGSKLVINGGYFDSGYYDRNAELPISENETAADIANRGKSADKNIVRTAIKNNTSIAFNLSWSSAAGTQDFKINGGTFVGANPAWGDEGCMLPSTNDNYLRPWSYYQGAFLEGQVYDPNGVVIPDGYTITEGRTDDDRPVFTVNYSK